MTAITLAQLHQFLANQGEQTTSYDEYLDDLEDAAPLLSTGPALIDRATYEALQKCELRIILADEEGEHYLSGEDLVELADNVVRAIHDGFRVATWNGPKALVVGYRPTELTISER